MCVTCVGIHTNVVPLNHFIVFQMIIDICAKCSYHILCMCLWLILILNFNFTILSIQNLTKKKLIMLNALRYGWTNGQIRSWNHNQPNRLDANTNPISVVFNLWLRRVRFGGFYGMTGGLYRFWSKKLIQNLQLIHSISTKNPNVNVLIW